MSPETNRLVKDLMLYYCVYQTTFKVDYKEPRRCDRYNILDRIIFDIESILEDEDIYREIMFQYYEYEEDMLKDEAINITWLLGTLDIGTFEMRKKKDENDHPEIPFDRYIYDELFEDISNKVNVKEILSYSYLDKLYKLKGKAEREMFELEQKYKEIDYGHIN